MSKFKKFPFIIAEVGVNHNGSVIKAQKLIDFASKNNIDAVKFQFFKASNLVSKNTGLAPYQKSKLKISNQYSMLKKYELDLETHISLSKYCKKRKIEYMTSFFDEESIKFHSQLNLKRLKVPSGELTNVPYLQEIAKINKQILLSTGMATLKDVIFALDVIIKKNPYHKKNIVIMQCTSEYPAPIDNVNLNVLKTYANLGFNIGFSDHTLGYDSSILAIALGVTYIEKHITLNNNLSGPDHKASLSINNFKIYASKINEAVRILGSQIKKPSKVENINSNFVKKKIVAKEIIKKGEIFTTKNLITKRSQAGTSAKHWNNMIGKKSKKYYKKGENV